jgi:iron complex outermembrane recepter protein
MTITGTAAHSRIRLALLGASALVSTALLAGPALAQDDGTAIEEVVVTARKVAENLQDVPVAVTVMSGTQLEAKNAVRLSDFALFTPGFKVMPPPTNITGFFLSSRGQVQGDTLATLDPSVGTYVDELNWARAYGLNANLLDVASVQMLKGPQGTLFGRNTTGGALLLTTNDPSFDGFSGKASASYGRFNEREGELILNMPLNDRIAVRGAIRNTDRDGWAYGIRQINPATGLPSNAFLPNGVIQKIGKYNDRNELTGRLKARVKFTENTELLLSGEWYKFHATPGRQMFYKVDLATAGDAVATTTPVLLYQAYEAAHPNAVGYDAHSCDFVSAAPANCADNIVERQSNYIRAHTETYSAKLTSETPLGQFKLIGGYRNVFQSSYFDLDGSSAVIHSSQQGEDLSQYSVEAQLAGQALSDKLDYVVGATWFKEDGLDTGYSFSNVAIGGIFGNRPAGNLPRNKAYIHNKSWGVYTQATYHLTDALGITGGLRYSKDDKGIDLRGSFAGLNGASTTCAITGVGSSATLANDCSFERSDKFDAISWTIGADYKLTDDILVYAKASRGYRGGGQNLRALALSQAIPFGPEYVNEEEIGVKADLLDRRLRINVAGFYDKVSDAQRTAIVATVINGIPVNNTLISNAAKVKNVGFEAELTARPTRELTLGASVGYVDAKYQRFIDAAGVDVRNQRITLVPAWTYALSAQYARPISDEISFSANLDYSWTDEYAADRCVPTGPVACWTLTTVDRNGLTAAQIGQNIVEATTMDSAGILNARMTFGFEDDKYRLAFWGRNLTNDRGKTQATYLQANPRNYAGGSIREPRTYGATVTAEF